MRKLFFCNRALLLWDTVARRARLRNACPGTRWRDPVPSSAGRDPGPPVWICDRFLRRVVDAIDGAAAGVMIRDSQKKLHYLFTLPFRSLIEKGRAVSFLFRVTGVNPSIASGSTVHATCYRSLRDGVQSGHHGPVTHRCQRERAQVLD